MVKLCVGNGNGWDVMVRKQTSFFHNLKVPKENPASQTRNPCKREKEREKRERKVEPWVWRGSKAEVEGVERQFISSALPLLLTELFQNILALLIFLSVTPLQYQTRYCGIHGTNLVSTFLILVFYLFILHFSILLSIFSFFYLP